MDNINKGEKMFIVAEQYAWGIAEGSIPELMNPLMNKKVEEGLKIKMIIEENLLAKIPPIKMSNTEIRGVPDSRYLGRNRKRSNSIFQVQ